MSYLLSGKVQTCYFNNVFCKIKIFEYLETGRYEDYRPRPGLKIFVKSPKIEIFGEWITFCEIMKKTDYIEKHFFSVNRSLFGPCFNLSKNRNFRWIDNSLTQIKQMKLLITRVICDLLNLPVNRSTPTTPSPWSNISPILLKLFLIFIKVRVLTPYTKPRDFYLRFQSKTACRPLKSQISDSEKLLMVNKVNPDLICSYHP